MEESVQYYFAFACNIRAKARRDKEESMLNRAMVIGAHGLGAENVHRPIASARSIELHTIRGSTLVTHREALSLVYFLSRATWRRHKEDEAARRDADLKWIFLIGCTYHVLFQPLYEDFLAR